MLPYQNLFCTAMLLYLVTLITDSDAPQPEVLANLDVLYYS